MTNETRTSDDIERDIADERAQMSDTIDDLQKKFSVDAILSDLGGMFRGQGGNIGRTIADTVGRNPAAVVLVGVGLAWLVLGQERTSAGTADRQRKARSSGDGGDTASRDFRVGSARPSARAEGGALDSNHYWYGNGQLSGQHSQKNQGANGKDGRTSGNADGGVTRTIRKGANAAGHAVLDAADGVGDAASDLMERLSHGLDDLTEDARSRIVSARRAAHDARQSAADMMARGSRAATGLFEAQPLVLGALAMAAGAAFGGILPHSKLEDDTMGDSSDRLFADAQALYLSERDKAVSKLKEAATDAKGELREIGTDLAELLPDGKSVGEVIVDRVADATTRVVQGATGDDVQPDRDRRPS